MDDSHFQCCGFEEAELNGYYLTEEQGHRLGATIAQNRRAALRHPQRGPHHGGGVSGFLWFAYTTRPDRLMVALNQKGLPNSLVYMVVATLQIVPRFQNRAAAILDAQRSRGLETQGNLLVRSRALMPLVIPLVLSSLIDVEERAMAIEVRGFNRGGLKTSLVEIAEAAIEDHCELRPFVLERAPQIVVERRHVAVFLWRQSLQPGHARMDDEGSAALGGAESSEGKTAAPGSSRFLAQVRCCRLKRQSSN